MSSNAKQTSGQEEDTAAEDDLVTTEEVEESVGILGGILDRLTTEDEFLGALLSNQVRLARTTEKMRELIAEIRLSRGADVSGKYVIEMSHSVPSDTLTTAPKETVRVPDEQNPSRLTGVSLGWQSGTNNVVGIQLRTGSGEKLMPRNAEDQFLAFNDFTDTFPVETELAPGEELVALTVNLDSTNSHFVNIVPHISELEPEESSDGGGS